MALTLSGDDGVAGVNGSATTPAIQGTDTNTGLTFGTDTVNVVTGGSTRSTVDSSGRLLVGTTTAQGNNRLQLEGSASGAAEWSGISLRRGVATASLTSDQYLGAISFQSQGGAEGGVVRAICDANWSASSHPTRLTFETTASSSTSPTERMRITPSGDLRFNSGYGSVATAFGVRAWINFDGTAATIGSGRASGNMDAVTDNGTGDYTINFTNDMPDANYCVQISIELDDTVNTNNFGVKNGSTPAVGSVRVAVGHEGGTLDTDRYFVSIIR